MAYYRVKLISNGNQAFPCLVPLDYTMHQRREENLHSSRFLCGDWWLISSPEDGIDRLSRKVGKKLPLIAA